MAGGAEVKTAKIHATYPRWDYTLCGLRHGGDPGVEFEVTAYNIDATIKHIGKARGICRNCVRAMVALQRRTR